MYDVNIDFDYASKCWRENKKNIGHGYFVYICNYTHSNGKRCRRTIYNCVLTNNYKYQFNNYDYFNINTKNGDIFCKRHLHRYRTI